MEEIKNVENNDNDENEEEKLIIENEWERINDTISLMIQKKIKKKEVENIEKKNYKIIVIIDFDKNNERKLLIKNGNNFTIFSISNKLRKIKFTFYVNDVKVEKDRIVLNPKEILDYIHRYNFKTPCYYKDTILHKINFGAVNDIFENIQVTEIFDLNMEDIPDVNEFQKHKLKIDNKVKDLYVDDNIDEFSDKIYNGLFQKTQKREDLNKIIESYIEDNNPILFLTGPYKIGKSVSILNSMENLGFQYLYIDLKYITSIKDENRSSYIFKECFRLFNSYKNYYNFLKTNYKLFLNLDDILLFIRFLIINMKNLFYDIIAIVLDNYEDFYMKKKLTNIYVENIIEILSKSKLKLIICGNGLYFNNLISEHFSGAKMKIDFYYIDDLQLQNLRQPNNDYLDYLINKYKIQSKVLFYLVLFKKALNPITGFIDFKNIGDFPSQFFIFKKKTNDKNIFIQFYSSELINNIDRDIKFYLLSGIVFDDLNYFNNLGFKGIVEEEIILTEFELGKIFSTNIEENNILTVKEIVSISSEVCPTNKKIDYNNPIIIRQSLSSAKLLDACLIIRDTLFFIQIGLNKDIANIYKILNQNFDSLLNDVSNYIRKEIKEYKILFIFDKMQIHNIYNKLNELREKKKQLQNILLQDNINLKNPMKTDKSDINYKEFIKLKKQISNLIYKIGPEICENKGVPYLLFSLDDFKLYAQDFIIKNLEDFYNTIIAKSNKIPEIIIAQLKELEDFKNLKNLKFLTKIGSKIMGISLDNNFCFLNCEATNFFDFNIEYYLDNNYFKISFKGGKIDSKVNEDDYSDYYLLEATFIKKKKIVKGIDD